MRIWGALLTCTITLSLGAFIDNRFFIPYLTTDPYFLSYENNAYFRAYTFAGSAYEAYGDVGNELPLFEFAKDRGTHPYEQHIIDQALQQAQRTDASLIPSEWELGLPQSRWNMDGHIEMQGFNFAAYYPLTEWVTIGGNWYFMFLSSRLELTQERDPDFDRVLASPGIQQELFDLKAQTHDALGLERPLFIEAEPGDIDIFARFSWNCEYAYKFQYIDLGLQTGFLIPTSEQQDIHNPASVPVGGNNHAGFYVTFNPHAILKDNIRAGWDLRVIKRFPETAERRMPVGNEPIQFGAAVGQAEVDPGVTVGFAPYLAFEELREGFGLLFRYAIVGHRHDTWRDINVADRTVSVDRDTLRDTSSWALEHVTAQAFYDFGYTDATNESSMRLIIKGEAPVEWLASQRAVKMFGASVAIEGSF